MGLFLHRKHLESPWLLKPKISICLLTVHTYILTVCGLLGFMNFNDIRRFLCVWIEAFNIACLNNNFQS